MRHRQLRSPRRGHYAISYSIFEIFPVPNKDVEHTVPERLIDDNAVLVKKHLWPK